MSNREFINFVRAYAKKHGLTYMCAMSQASVEWRKKKAAEEESRLQASISMPEYDDLSSAERSIVRTFRKFASKKYKDTEEFYNKLDIDDQKLILDAFKNYERL